MAVGDQASNAGWPLVPETGEEGRVRWGAREINRTRDFAAEVKMQIPLSKAAWQKKCGISYGNSFPPSSTVTAGDIFIKTVPIP